MLQIEHIHPVFIFSVYHLVLTAMIIFLFNLYEETILEGWNNKNKKSNLNSTELAGIKQQKIKARNGKNESKLCWVPKTWTS